MLAQGYIFWPFPPFFSTVVYVEKRGRKKAKKNVRKNKEEFQQGDNFACWPEYIPLMLGLKGFRSRAYYSQNTEFSKLGVSEDNVPIEVNIFSEFLRGSMCRKIRVKPRRHCFMAIVLNP